MNVQPSFQGEVQFRRWSDSSTQGVQVTFALPDSEALEPLKHMAGKRFMAVLVELGDDEQPVPPAPRKDTRGPLCREACDLCRDPAFQAWVTNEGFGATEEGAKAYVLEACEVQSRKDLDDDKAAGRRFVSRVRIPFFRWNYERRSA